MDNSYTFDKIGYLALLDRFRATGCDIVPLREITTAKQIGLRHDVDDDLGKALAMARLEAEQGVRATYFLLDTAEYWPPTRSDIAELVSLGHEVGWHNNAITRHLLWFDSLLTCVAEPIETLRDLGAEVVGTASHGDALCHELSYVNYHIWQEYPVDTPHKRFSLSEFGLLYEAYWLPTDRYLSDSGGSWNRDVDHEVGQFERGDKPMQVLIHPQWWQL